MILMGIDFGSSQLPWAIQEPQIINQEFRGVKEPGLCLFSLPKKYANVSRVEKVRRRNERAIQSVVEKGSRKVNQLTSRPGNWTKNLVATVLSPGEKWTALPLVSVMNKLAKPTSARSSTRDPITPLHFLSFPKAPYCKSLDGRTIVERLLQTFMPDIPENPPDLGIFLLPRKESVENCLRPKKMPLEVLTSQKNAQ